MSQSQGSCVRLIHRFQDPVYEIETRIINRGEVNQAGERTGRSEGGERGEGGRREWVGELHSHSEVAMAVQVVPNWQRRRQLCKKIQQNL